MPLSPKRSINAVKFEQIAIFPAFIASNIVIPKLSECVCGAIKKPTFLIIEFFSSSEISIRYFIKSSL